MEALTKIKNLKVGDIFDMDGKRYIITRSGHGHPDVEFKLKGKSKDTLVTNDKDLMVSFVKGNLVKIKNLKAGDIFEMDGNKCVITRPGHGYHDVEFKLKNKGKDTLTTNNKNLVVRFIKEKV